MANGQGGPRTPANPAPVSGPGALSQRTDGRQPARWISGGQYGEGKENMDLQTSAPMNEAVSTPPMATGPANLNGPAAPSGPIRAGSSAIPLFAPTERPDEPVTAGASVGPGYTPVRSQNADRLSTILPYLPMLQEATTWPDAPDTFKALVRYLQGQPR